MDIGVHLNLREMMMYIPDTHRHSTDLHRAWFGTCRNLGVRNFDP